MALWTTILRLLIIISTTDAEKNKLRETMRGVQGAKEWNKMKMKKLYVMGSNNVRELATDRPLQSASMSHAVHDEMKMEISEDFERFLAKEQERKEEEYSALLIAAETRKQAIEDAKRKEVEDKAIKHHVAKIKKAEEELTKKRDELQKKLGERGGLTSQQINIVVDEAFPSNTGNDALLLRHTDTSLETHSGHVHLQKEKIDKVAAQTKVKGLSRLR